MGRLNVYPQEGLSAKDPSQRGFNLWGETEEDLGPFALHSSKKPQPQMHCGRTQQRLILRSHLWQGLRGFLLVRAPRLWRKQPELDCCLARRRGFIQAAGVSASHQKRGTVLHGAVCLFPRGILENHRM